MNFCWTNGTTNTPPPTTTFWPLLSVKIRPVSGSVDFLPRRPVTMNASLGPHDLVAGDDDEGEQNDEYDDSHRSGEDRAHAGFPCSEQKVTNGQWSTGRTATDVADSAASTHTLEPRASGTVLLAASFTG